MEGNSSSIYTNAAKDWVSSLTGVTSSSLNVFKFEKNGQNYDVGVEAYSAGKTIRYLVVVGESGNIISHKEMSNAPQGGSAGTLLTVAMAFSIIFVVVFIIEFILAIVTFSAIAAIPGGTIFDIAGLIVGVLYLLMFLVSIYCLVRIIKIRRLYNEGRYQEAYDSNTVLFGILTLLFNGLIPGILMLVARGSMKPTTS